MLIGFTIVAAPLLFAIVNAAVQMNRLSVRSQQLVVHGMQGTRNNQRMFEEIGGLERQARLYQVIGDAKLLDVYASHHARLVTAIQELLTLPLDEASQQGVRAVESKAKSIAAGPAVCGAELDPHGGTDRQLSAAVGRGVQCIGSDQPADRSRNGELELATQHAQQNLVWQTLLLVPMTLAVVGVFTFLFARPIRAIDRAISELGRGSFSRPIAIQGPADLERLAAQLEWLRSRLLDLAQEKNRFLRHMSHELKLPWQTFARERTVDGRRGG